MNINDLPQAITGLWNNDDAKYVNLRAMMPGGLWFGAIPEGILDRTDAGESSGKHGRFTLFDIERDENMNGYGEVVPVQFVFHHPSGSPKDLMTFMDSFKIAFYENVDWNTDFFMAGNRLIRAELRAPWRVSPNDMEGGNEMYAMIAYWLG